VLPPLFAVVSSSSVLATHVSVQIPLLAAVRWFFSEATSSVCCLASAPTDSVHISSLVVVSWVSRSVAALVRYLVCASPDSVQISLAVRWIFDNVADSAWVFSFVACWICDNVAASSPQLSIALPDVDCVFGVDHYGRSLVSQLVDLSCNKNVILDLEGMHQCCS
jgi:hypothetical protein